MGKKQPTCTYSVLRYEGVSDATLAIFGVVRMAASQAIVFLLAPSQLSIEGIDDVERQMLKLLPEALHTDLKQVMEQASCPEDIINGMVKRYRGTIYAGVPQHLDMPILAPAPKILVQAMNGVTQILSDTIGLAKNTEWLVPSVEFRPIGHHKALHKEREPALN